MDRSRRPNPIRERVKIITAPRCVEMDHGCEVWARKEEKHRVQNRERERDTESGNHYSPSVSELKLFWLGL